MGYRGKKSDRREHERYKVQADAFAMVTPLSSRRNEIIDISRGGLALSYTPYEEQARVSVEIDLFLHIFLKDVSFCLLRMPITTVSDCTAGEKNGSKNPRRRSVQFGRLSQNQINELEYFLENHALS